MPIDNEVLQPMLDAVQDGNINILMGSGSSVPFLPTLGNIEELLTSLEKQPSLSDEKKKIIRVSLYKKYFDDVLAKNIEILKRSTAAKTISDNYEAFLKHLNKLLLARKSTVLAKQVNLFTTNVDIFLEKALEEARVEYNDGFSGRFDPIFNLSNFKKSAYKKSLHYDNKSEIPMFNLLKMHGSLVWQSEDDEQIKFSPSLELIRKLKEIKIPANAFVKDINERTTISELIEKASNASFHESLNAFMTTYDKLCIVNPTKEKFQMTLLNRAYYEILRLYSNELEKENTILFVMGFSFADEHIREITLRAANSNPTLKIYIFARQSSSVERFKKKFDYFKQVKYDNIQIVRPSQTDGGTEIEFGFKEINESIFEQLLKKTSSVQQIET